MKNYYPVFKINDMFPIYEKFNIPENPSLD